MVRLWRAFRPAPGRVMGMAVGYLPVAGHLPEAGGVGNQAAVMIEAFDVMTRAEISLLEGRDP